MTINPQVHDTSTPRLTTVEVFDGKRSLGLATLAGKSWTLITHTPLALGAHSFNARSSAQTSNTWAIIVEEQDSGLKLPRPHVEGASAGSGDNEHLKYKGDIAVIIPNYNMRAGDTVKLYWFGRSITLGSAIQIVGTPPSLKPFVISKYEVSDGRPQKLSATPLPQVRCGDVLYRTQYRRTRHHSNRTIPRSQPARDCSPAGA